MRFLHVSVSNLVHSIPSCDRFFQSSQLYLLGSILSTSVVLHDGRQSSCGCFGSRASSCLKTNHGSAAWFVNQGPRLVVELGWQPRCIGKLVTDWYVLRKVLKQLTEQSPLDPPQ